MNLTTEEARTIVRERPALAQAIAKLWNERHAKAPKTNLTARQRDALEFIGRYAAENSGGSPTFREIQTALGLSSVSRVGALVAGLEERGFIIRNPSRSRSIRII